MEFQKLERLVKSGSTVSVGFNDSFLDVRHPSGIRTIGGFRVGIGPIQIGQLLLTNFALNAQTTGAELRT